jgi:hypothetical protein
MMIGGGRPERGIMLFLNPVSGPRVKRLGERNRNLWELPALRHLHQLLDAHQQEIEITPEEFDGLTSLLQLFNAEPELPTEVFDPIIDGLLTKFMGKGGMSIDVSQIPDLVYEGQVALLLAQSMPAWFEAQAEDYNRPDHVFHVQFETTEKPTRLAIECKNIRKCPNDVRELIVSVARAIRKAVRQHQGRSAEFKDLIIFVDLPIEVLTRSVADYHRLVVNVFRSLRASGLDWLDESQVIFTATGQSNMAAHLLEGKPTNQNLTVLAPVVCGVTSMQVYAPRLLFLSALFRAPGQNINAYNWSKVAKRISDPESYEMQLAPDKEESGGTDS